MRTRVCLSFALLVAIPVSGQVNSTSGANQGNGTEMLTPPPISDQPYSTKVGVEVRSNYLSLGLTENTAYVDNFFVGSAGVMSETSFSILPTISFDQKTGRQDRTFMYSPGFTFYQPSSQLNEIDQAGSLRFQYRITPHATFSLGDAFQQSSTSFSSAFAGADGAVSGSPELPAQGVLAPFAERLTNNANAQFTIQVAPRAMVGGSGNLMLLDYPKPSEADGLYNSHDISGSAFYDHRVSGSQYIGITYGDSFVRAAPLHLKSDVQTQTLNFFYTYYPKPALSLSVSGGPQHYDISQTGVPTYTSWEPTIMASMGWQGLHTNFAASYAREVTAGGGLLGAFESNIASATARWKMSRTMTAGASGNYAINKTINIPVAFLATPGGHSVTGSATVSRALSQTLHLAFEYDRVHQTYSEIPVLSSNPNADRVMVSVMWQATRPIGQ